MAAVGLYSGAFKPPHVRRQVARAAALRPDRKVCLSPIARPQVVHAPAEDRLDSRAAFPDDDVRLDPHPRTIDLRDGARIRSS